MTGIIRIPTLIALIFGAGLVASPAQATCGKACQLILKGYQRDQTRCRMKWQRILAQCKKAQNPSPDNNCGVPIVTTSSTTSTSTTTSTESTCAPPPPRSTTTTFPPCTEDGDRCGALGRVCRCTHFCEGNGQCNENRAPPEPTTGLLCVERGSPIQGGCATDTDCPEAGDHCVTLRDRANGNGCDPSNSCQRRNDGFCVTECTLPPE